MLNSFCKGACAAAAMLTFGAGAAHADNIEVLIVDGSYFPSVVFATAGDNIIFRNRSDGAHVVGGPDEAWSSDSIPVNGSYSLNLTPTTPSTFSSISGSAETATGEIVFSEAPVTSD
ncbi:hypothetical protein Z945_3328 [Sulfitobacter noctilucae]|uniref:cupredoxin domain-containing protein n=1 Tax=Sulfitobacter noctilucae TaxID=1342302 RepID=UPI00046813F9|nr:cupredoxin domain-containing protein [Sulfitobacter noctilucae]KIN70864.1 hypothetical protein Z945_3328 [Sulfitobacter noctilucae]